MTCKKCKHWEKSTELEHWGMCEEFKERTEFEELLEIAKEIAKEE